MSLTSDEVDYVRRLVYAESGIVIQDDKDYLIYSRLLRAARSQGLKSISQLLAYARRESARETLRRRIVEALTTNETSFFRDVHPFDALRTHVLPGLIASRASQRHMNIWSAACSSGQEPYSIAMLIHESFPELAQWQLRILATDLNHEVLEQAVSGRYTAIQVKRGLPAKLLARYFHPQPNGDWQLNPEIMRMVEFSAMNLNSPAWISFPALATPVFDIVFLRNVMIYFDDHSKQQILERVRRLLRPDGHLALGSSETTQHLASGFEPQRLGDATFFRVPPPLQ